MNVFVLLSPLFSHNAHPPNTFPYKHFFQEWNTKFGTSHGRQADVMAQERRRWSKFRV